MFSFISEGQIVWYETMDKETISLKLKSFLESSTTQMATIDFLY